MQFTNPAGYPPLQHSAHMLADAGWDVLFLGAAADGSHTLVLPSHPNICVRRLRSFGNGLLQRANYAVFISWVLFSTIIWKPRWIYASDAMGCLPTILAQNMMGCKVAYHEHDTPSYAKNLSILQRMIRRARDRLARTADLVIVPQHDRLEVLLSETGRLGTSLCVWNCPAISEVMSPIVSSKDPEIPIRFYFHGSINATRLPDSILEALARSSESATLTIVGYETVGSKGYINKFLTRATALGLGGRVIYSGAQSRTDTLRFAAQADVGLALMPKCTADLNMLHMVGASNKPFDYLAMRTLPIVSDLPDWRRAFVDPGFAIACDPYDVDNLTEAFAWCVTNPSKVQEMAEAGAQMILKEWNYEKQFADTKRLLQSELSV